MTQLDQPKGIIAWFASNPVAANLLMLLIITLGIVNMADLNKEAFPSLPPNSIDIYVSNDSGSAKENEEGIAIPIEEQLQDVLGIQDVTTTSTATNTTVSVEMLDGYNIKTLKDDIKDALDQITSFPDEADPALVEESVRKEHALWLQLHGNTDRRTLQKLAYDLRTDLLAEEDITTADISGWRDPTMIIDVNKNALEAYDLTLSDISTAINQESSPAQVATVRSKDVYLHVSASEQAYFKQQFANIQVKTTSNGGKIRLADIATIRDAFNEDDFILSRYNQQSSIAIEIITTGQGDISDSVIAARKVIEKWQDDGRLPPNVELSSWYDRSESINQRLDLMIENAITGILLVFILLAVFLNVTVAFWVAMGLPFIFFGTLYFMGTQTIGLTLNMFTTFGFIMALGIVVDDAVVVGENVYTVRSKEGDTLNNTIKATMQVAVPTLFGVFTTVAAFWALANIDGRLGQLYSQFAIVVAICLVLSVVESKIILPAHLAHLRTKKSPNPHLLARAWGHVQKTADGGLQWFSDRIYRPVIDLALHHRYAVLILFIAVFFLIMSMPFTGSLRISFFPRIPGDTVRGELTMYNDVSYGQTSKALAFLEKTAYQADLKLRSKAQPEDNNSQSSIDSMQVMASDDQSGNLRIELHSDRSYTAAQFVTQWQKLVGMPEGVKSLRLSSARALLDDLKVELRSTDNSVLAPAMQEMVSQLDRLPAISGVEQNAAPSESRLALKLNDQGRLLGLSTAELASQVRNNFDHLTVQQYQRDNTEIDVELGYPSGQQASPAAILNTKIVLTDGTRVPLSSVANLVQEDANTQIIRIDGKRSLFLTAEVDKDLMSSTEVVAYLEQAVVPQITRKYAGIDVYFSGEAEQRAETQSSMSTMFLIALLVIYALLAIPLKSYSQPLIIMMAIPFGVIGALLGHWINDLPLGIFSLNGILALSGVVVNDSLLLVSRFNALRKEETSHVQKAINIACRSRLRAVLLTSFTTFAGLMPILGETSRQAQMLIPAAVSLGYGIMFATVITLILIPVLLMIKEDLHGLFSRLKRASTPVSDSLNEPTTK